MSRYRANEGDSPHDVTMLRRLLSSSSVAASRYRLLAASHGLSKHGEGPKAENSGVSVVGEDACCVCEAGDRTLLGDNGSGRSHRFNVCMHLSVSGLAALQG